MVRRTKVQYLVVVFNRVLGVQKKIVWCHARYMYLDGPAQFQQKKMIDLEAKLACKILALYRFVAVPRRKNK